MTSPHLTGAKTLRACEDARHDGAPAFTPRVSKFAPAHCRYTPELLASGRVRYEQTTETLASIAADFDIQPKSFRRMAQRFNWVRHGTAPRSLPPVTRLRAEAEALEHVLLPPPEPVAEPEPETPLSAIDRLERAVMAELASVERMRSYLGKYPMMGREAMKTARTLATLTDTLGKLHRLRAMSGGAAEKDPEAEHDPRSSEAIAEMRRNLVERLQILHEAYEEEVQAQNDALTAALWPD